MILLKNNLIAELIKFKKGCFFWIHLLAPLAGALIVELYYHMTNMTVEDKFIMYMMLVAAAFPFMISLITAISFQKEEENNFYNLLSASKRSVVFISKFIVMFGMGCLSALIALVSFPILIGKCYTVMLLFKLFLTICIPNVILYIVHSFLCLRFGKNASIFVGIVGTLISFVFVTSMGDNIWKFVPWSMGTRGVNLLILIDTVSLNQYEERKQTFLNDFSGLPIICIVEIIIALILFLIWFNRWEGRKVYE